MRRSQTAAELAAAATQLEWLPAGLAFAEEGWGRAELTQKGHLPAQDRCPSRRREFEAGRRVVRRAGRTLDLNLDLLPVGATRAPSWPTGAVGSITHCYGYAAGLAARTSVHQTVGLDAEPWRPLNAATLHYIATNEELRQVTALQHSHPDVPWCRILFTAKEATYKALSFLGQRVGFHQAHVRLSPSEISVVGSTTELRHRLNGVWRRRAQYDTVVTAVWANADPVHQNQSRTLR